MATPRTLDSARAGRRALVLAALLAAAGGCTPRDVTSVENGVWQMVTGHDKPIILEPPPPPVYCYRTIGGPQCEDQPIERDRSAAIR
ncbi:MAG TPA: hypothetical protein VGB88_06235 [Alphaproteobacteria bacterium]